VAGSPFAVNSLTPVDITFNSGGSRVYVSNFDGNEITLFNMDTVSGKLSLQESLMTRLSPWSLALLPEGERVMQPTPQTLLATGGKAGLMRLTKAADGVTDSVVGHGDALAVAPNGRFAYALNTKEGTITSYALESKQGYMTAISGGVVKTGVKPTDITIDVNGWYLYVTNSGDASLSIYYINPSNGIPEPVRGSPVRSGKRPVAIALDPAARFAYVVNAESNSVSVYRYLNNVTPLMFEGRKYGSPFAAGKEPLALAAEPTGHFVYVANAGANNISVYRVHRKTGGLAPIPGSPFKTGQRPVALQVHPNGRWLYVANQGASTLTIHHIEAGLGALAKDRETVALPLQPIGIWFDEAGHSLLVLGKDRRRVLRYSVDGQTGELSLQSDKRLPQALNDLALARTVRK
jgi:6-phosphogluconolactonase (cycloisomerase 2 family)